MSHGVPNDFFHVRFLLLRAKSEIFSRLNESHGVNIPDLLCIVAFNPSLDKCGKEHAIPSARKALPVTLNLIPEKEHELQEGE